MSYLTGLSSYILKSVLDDYSSGQREYCHANLGMSKSLTGAAVTFICWMKKFALFYGQYAPDSKQIILSYWLNKAALFKIYKEEAPGPHLSQSAFYENFKTQDQSKLYKSDGNFSFASQCLF